jgi:hypothetical protein
VFVLALTSNKEGPEVQHATAPDGGTVAGRVLDELRGLNDGAFPLGSFGAVVGATIGDTTESLDINGPLLAPGYGAQGGTPADIRRIFGTASGAVLASSSRELLALGPDPPRCGTAYDARTTTSPAHRMRVAWALPALLVGALLAGCASEQENYCDAVKDHQDELTEIAAEVGQTGLLDALPVYRELQDQAPADITDEWQQVVTSLEDLDRTLDDAGVDPATYDPKNPPPDLSDDEVAAIADAADRVGSLETQRALQGLEQQALDVCQTPLSL